MTELFWMGQGKLGRGTQQQHKKATPHSSPCQNEQQTTGGMEFVHIYDTRGTYQYSAGILVRMQKIVLFRFFAWCIPRSGDLRNTRFVYSRKHDCLLLLAVFLLAMLNFLSFSRFFLRQSVCPRAAWWLYCTGINEAAYYLNGSVSFSVSHQKVGRFRSFFWKKPKRNETETKHVSVGF